MKNKSILKAIGVIILVTFILTWIVPSATVGTSGITIGNIMPTGFADIFTSLDVITYYFVRPAIFIIFVGMFYGVVNKIGALKGAVDNISSLFKDKKDIFLIITLLFYALITALTGIYLPLFMFVPLSVAILTKLKYNKVQIVLATVGASTIGLIGQISNNVIRTLSEIEENTFIWVKVGLLVLLLVLTIVYILKVNNKKDKTEKETTEEKIMFVPTKRDSQIEVNVKGTSLIIVMSLLLIVFILGLTPWQTEIFSDAYADIQNVKIGEFAPFDALLGSFETFGEWTYNSLYPTVALAIIIMAFTNMLTFSEFAEACVKGAKKVAGLAVMSAIITIIVVFTLNSGFMGTIINLIAKGGNIALITLSSLISSPFMVELDYAAQYNLSMIYSATASESIAEIWTLIVQVTYGFVMLIVPSSVFLMVGLGYVEETYSKWVKYIWKLLLAILILCIAAILIASLI